MSGAVQGASITLRTSCHRRIEGERATPVNHILVLWARPNSSHRMLSLAKYSSANAKRRQGRQYVSWLEQVRPTWNKRAAPFRGKPEIVLFDVSRDGATIATIMGPAA